MVRMVSLTIMAPTKTDRRHFFLIEDESDSRDLVTNTLTSIGFHVSSVNNDQFVNGVAQVSIGESSQNGSHHFLAGAISPPSHVIEKHRRYLSRFKILGLLHFSVMTVSIFEWPLALIAYFAGQLGLLRILEAAIPITLLAWFLLAAALVVSGALLESVTTSLNYHLASQICPKIISRISQLDSKASVDEIGIKTSWGQRDIEKRLPESFREKLEQLNLGKVNAFYWGPGGYSMLSKIR